MPGTVCTAPQVVVARHAEDISWSDPFAAVRTVYEKPGMELWVHPLVNTAGDRGWSRAAPEAASVVLPNVGKEQHTYLTHIVRNYDSLSGAHMPALGMHSTHGRTSTLSAQELYFPEATLLPVLS